MATVCVILGLAVFSFGVGCIYIPAGMIAAGASLVALGLAMIRGGHK